MHCVSNLGPALIRISLTIAFCCVSQASRGDADLGLVLADLDAQIAAEPAKASLVVRRAEIQLKAGNWQAALVDLDRAERLDGALPLALPRARALMAGGHCPHAKAALDEFLAAHPGNAGALIERARAEARLGEAQAAVVDYRAALPLVAARAEPDLILEIAGHFHEAGIKHEALRALDAALTARPGCPALIARALEIEVACGDFEGALRRAGAAIETSARPEAWLARRASILAQAGRFAEAESAWESLLARLASLPETERASHAMQRVAEQSRNALASLRFSTRP